MDSRKLVPKASAANREDQILRLAAGRSVLHIGMGGFVSDDGVTSAYLGQDLRNALHGRLADVAETLTGTDINPLVLEAFSKVVPGEYVLGDITALDAPQSFDRRFGLIVFSDVVEHLDSARPALQNLLALMEPGGVAVITTANAFGVERYAKMLFRYESVHPEHTAYYSYATMERLLGMSGLQISDFCYYWQPRHGGGSVTRLSYFVARLLGWFLPQYSEGLVFVVEREAVG